MKENTDIAKQLNILYNEGLKITQVLNATFKNVDISYLPGLATFGPKPEKKNDFDYDKFESEVKTLNSEWSEKVLAILSADGRVRFELQFEDPKVPYIHMPGFRDDSQLDRIEEELEKFGDKVTVLREIVIQIDSDSENTSRQLDDKVEPATYESKSRAISIAGRIIKFKKNAIYGPIICEIMFAEKDKEFWQLKDFQKIWDSQYDYIENRPTDWQRVHNVILKLNARIAKVTGISDLFLLSTKSVYLNRIYIAKK